MNEATGNLWTFPAEIRVITTNLFVKRNGEAVMGRGCAREAAQRWPHMPALLGRAILDGGVSTTDLGTWSDEHIVAMPVKHNWWKPADLSLIEHSAQDLADLTTLRKWSTVVLPRPGCGNGQLSWRDVEPVLRNILDNRFTVITFAKGDLP